MQKYLFVKAILVVLIFVLTGCSMSKEEIRETVKQSMQESLSNDPDFSSYKLEVKEVTLVKSDNRKYSGYAEVEHNGKIHQVSLSVTVDGTDVLWEAKEGAFLFLAEKEINEIQDALSEYDE